MSIDDGDTHELIPTYKRRKTHDPNIASSDEDTDDDDSDTPRVTVVNIKGENVLVEPESALLGDDIHGQQTYLDLADEPAAQTRESAMLDVVRQGRADIRRERKYRQEREALKLKPTSKYKRNYGKPDITPALKKKKKSRSKQHPDMSDCWVDIEPLQYTGVESDDAVEERLSAERNRRLRIKTNGDQSFIDVAKVHKSVYDQLPEKQWSQYRIWLLTKPPRLNEPEILVEDLPKSCLQGSDKLASGLILPYPSGPHWYRILNDETFWKQKKHTISEEDQEEAIIYNAHKAFLEATRDERDPFEVICYARMARLITDEQMDAFIDEVKPHTGRSQGEVGHAYKARRPKKKRQKVQSDHDPAPKNIMEALTGDRADEWAKSINAEFDGLNDQGVFSHDWTWAKLKAAGITSRPVPCSTVFDHKWKDGKLEKLKTRICIAGHQGNVKQGIHYDKVFSASPVQHTERMLQALRVNLRLENLAWDIAQAYTWADLPRGERIAVVYPSGFRRYNDDGEELFAVLEKNLYGMPNAARGWGQCRDEFILERFNRSGWRCARTLMDPCLYVVDKYVGEGKGQLNHPIWKGTKDKFPAMDPKFDGLDPTKASSSYIRSYMLIHTDDVDAYGQDLAVLHEINNAMNAEWKTKLVDEKFILGVQRDVDKNPDGWTVKVSMPNYIDDLYNSFQPLMKEMKCHKVPPRPFPEGVILTKAHTPADGEVDRNIKRGYQRLVGSLLWCVRHVSPISQYGCSQLCKLMACPTDKAMEAALKMLGYLHAHRNEGIVFRETDASPICFVDASNKDDPSDGKTQYGFHVHWGGPVAWKSSKLQHVGLNSTYNEYMALTHAIKHVYWTRQLLEGMGLAYLIQEPSLIHADNKQANTLCAEDLVTNGNMYFRTHYHYNKEAVRDKYVIVQWIDTSENISDTMTKGLGNVKLKQFEPTLHGHEEINPDLLRRRKGPLEV